MRICAFYIRKNKINKKLRVINIYVILMLSPLPVQNKTFFYRVINIYEILMLSPSPVQNKNNFFLPTLNTVT